MCVMVIMFVCVFKQKTAYEMRISDWSSDVCSSDLRGARRKAGARAALPARLCAVAGSLWRGTGAAAPDADGADQHRAAPCLGSGSASGRRVHHHPRRLFRGGRGMFGGQLPDRDARLFGVRGASLLSELAAANRLRSARSAEQTSELQSL